MGIRPAGSPVALGMHPRRYGYAWCVLDLGEGGVAPVLGPWLVRRALEAQLRGRAPGNVAMCWTPSDV